MKEPKQSQTRNRTSNVASSLNVNFKILLSKFICFLQFDKTLSKFHKKNGKSLCKFIFIYFSLHFPINSQRFFSLDDGCNAFSEIHGRLELGVAQTLLVADFVQAAVFFLDGFQFELFGQFVELAVSSTWQLCELHHDGDVQRVAQIVRRESQKAQTLVVGSADVLAEKRGAVH